MTNGDDYRMKSDEELAELIMCPFEGEKGYPFPNCFENSESCYQCTLRFLKKEKDGGEKNA